MKCAICGKEYEVNPNARRKQKYCSHACRQQAYKLRKNIGAKPVKVGGRTPKAVLARDDFGYSSPDIPADRHAFERRMEREMDEPLETTLRRSRAKLQAVIDDPDTPANAIAKLTEALISVSRQLEEVTGAASQGVDLLADEEEAIDDELGAAII